jgi:hypothetical protein
VPARNRGSFNVCVCGEGGTRGCALDIAVARNCGRTRCVHKKPGVAMWIMRMLLLAFALDCCGRPVEGFAPSLVVLPRSGMKFDGRLRTRPVVARPLARARQRKQPQMVSRGLIVGGGLAAIGIWQLLGKSMAVVVEKGVATYMTYFLEMILMKGLLWQILTLLSIGMALTASIISAVFTLNAVSADIIPFIKRKVAERQNDLDGQRVAALNRRGQQAKQAIFALRTNLKRMEKATGLNITLWVAGICAFLGIVVKASVDGIVANNGPIVEKSHLVILSDRCNEQVVVSSRASPLTSQPQSRNPKP